ncbi:MAG TPA: hypothetical protein VGG40_00535 [Solirubrobacterales bacterium]
MRKLIASAPILASEKAAGRSRDGRAAEIRRVSEPRTRPAMRSVRWLRPRAAWRPARVAGIGFRLLRWPTGTGPNWQSYRFPGAASLVVETPRGRLRPSPRSRLTEALSRTGERVGEDPGVPRKG